MNNIRADSPLPDVRSVGIFGGTFDPVHVGHLILAEISREQLGLDLVLFVPAFVPPHKTTGRSIASGAHRLRMLTHAIESNTSFEVSGVELDRGGVSYTYDTLMHLLHSSPTWKPTLLIGADNAADFISWRSAEKITEMAEVAVWARAGTELPSELLPGVGYYQVDTPLIEISSTDIRARVSTDRSIRYLTPEPVAEYIYANGLYR